VKRRKVRKGSSRSSVLNRASSLQYHADPIRASSTEGLVFHTATDLVPLVIGNEEKVEAYYETALKHIQQLNCRQMAKAFIKFIEPRKQVKHPYNGGRPPPGAPPGTKGDPEKTKPDWWPTGVVHKEPDHLKKERKFSLPIYILSSQ
jgi:hypothetical protein